MFSLGLTKVTANFFCFKGVFNVVERYDGSKINCSEPIITTLEFSISYKRKFLPHVEPLSVLLMYFALELLAHRRKRGLCSPWWSYHVLLAEPPQHALPCCIQPLQSHQRNYLHPVQADAIHFIKRAFWHLLQDI